MRRRPLLHYLATTLLLLVTLFICRLIDIRPPIGRLKQPLASIPARLGSWIAIANEELASSELERLLPSDYITRLYRKDDWQLSLLVTYYSHQRAGAVMHSPKVCLPGSGWEIAKQDYVTVESKGKAYGLNKFHIQNAGTRMLVVYWYQTRNRIVKNEFAGKFFLVSDGLSNMPTDGSMVRIIVPDTPGASEQASEFSGLMIPELARCFGTPVSNKAY
jgi:EpsI family protein